jgi:hypothetical protein
MKVRKDHEQAPLYRLYRRLSTETYYHLKVNILRFDEKQKTVLFDLIFRTARSFYFAQFFSMIFVYIRFVSSLRGERV